ncbi:Alcohol acetyltransferase [Elasticomyces elasticus]|uniref:Alcohol acetyltransferase n=1 Tax=Elasticomyces elasticus TaxID=574655 RepID=A0AAN7WHC5_9PEZI|nr:Alcohol acetyltransferase [Elasticomyces elasticus]
MNAVVRPAGLNERRCLSRDVLGVYGTLVMCARYHQHGDVPLRDLINKALKSCIIEHPVLRTIILDVESEKPKLAQQTALNLNDHVLYLELNDTRGDGTHTLQALLEHAHNEPLDQWHLRPAWRLYVVPVSSVASMETATQFHLAFTYSHALADGFSGMLFHRTFLEALNSSADNAFDNKPDFHCSSDMSSLLPPLENAAVLPISWSFLLRPLVGEFLPSLLVRALGLSSEKSSNLWTGAQERPKFPPNSQLLHTAVRHRLIPNMFLERALAACRTHQARLTGLLAFTVARALSAALQARGIVQSEYRATLPIDLRRHIPEAQNSMANYASATYGTVTVVQEQQQILTDRDWSMVQELTNALTKASSTLADHPVALLKYLSNFRDWTLRQVSKPAEGSFEVSNAGAFDNTVPPTGAGWTLQDMVFSQSANALGDPFNVNVASTKGGPLAVVLTWWPGMLGVEDEEKLMDEVCDGLEEQLASL